MGILSTPSQGDFRGSCRFDGPQSAILGGFSGRGGLGVSSAPHLGQAWESEGASPAPCPMGYRLVRAQSSPAPHLGGFWWAVCAQSPPAAHFGVLKGRPGPQHAQRVQDGAVKGTPKPLGSTTDVLGEAPTPPAAPPGGASPGVTSPPWAPQNRTASNPSPGRGPGVTFGGDGLQDAELLEDGDEEEDDHGHGAQLHALHGHAGPGAPRGGGGSSGAFGCCGGAVPCPPPPRPCPPPLARAHAFGHGARPFFQQSLAFSNTFSFFPNTFSFFPILSHFFPNNFFFFLIVSPFSQYFPFFSPITSPFSNTFSFFFQQFLLLFPVIHIFSCNFSLFSNILSFSQ